MLMASGLLLRPPLRQMQLLPPQALLLNRFIPPAPHVRRRFCFHSISPAKPESVARAEAARPVDAIPGLPVIHTGVIQE